MVYLNILLYYSIFISWFSSLYETFLQFSNDSYLSIIFCIRTFYENLLYFVNIMCILSYNLFCYFIVIFGTFCFCIFLFYIFFFIIDIAGIIRRNSLSLFIYVKSSDIFCCVVDIFKQILSKTSTIVFFSFRKNKEIESQMILSEISLKEPIILEKKQKKKVLFDLRNKYYFYESSLIIPKTQYEKITQNSLFSIKQSRKEYFLIEIFDTLEQANERMKYPIEGQLYKKRYSILKSLFKK